MPIEFDDLRQIVIDCIKFKILFPAPFNGFRQGFSGTAGPENEFIAIAFPFLEVSNQSSVGLAKFWPFTVAESPIKINGNRFERDSFIVHWNQLLHLISVQYSCIQIVHLPGSLRSLPSAWHRGGWEWYVRFLC